MWEKTKRYSKKGFDKTWDTIDKLGAPVNRLSNKLGAEAFWPMAIDKESDKAARILRSFCKDGFYAPESEEYTDADGKINRPKGKQRVVKKIPSQVVKNAKGLAIFTTMRTGLWVSGSGGSGVLLARIPETGEWSPPSGIMLHTAGIGFLAGVDIYDCVVVINTYEALEGFKKVRCTLGGELSVSAGPVGAGGVLDSEVHKRQAPVWTYMKSKGLYAGVAVDGTIIIERTDENEKFYGERISVSDILAGKARHPPDSLRTLQQTIKAAQGDTDVDEDVIPPPGETPGDIDLQDTEGFGVPDPDDPDPYGVKALEAEGLFIREASTKVRASPENFQFKPSVSSPVYATFRRSLDSSRNSWRASVQSYTSVDRGTQTHEAPLTATTSVSRASSRSAKESTGIPVSSWDEDAQWDTVPIHGGEEEEEERKEERKLSGAPHRDTHESDDDIEVHEVSNVAVSRPESKASSSSPVEESDSKRTSPTFTRARLVTIAKRPAPPALPPRHPRHTWGSGSSRESPSPTAHSHSTEPTDVEYEPVQSVETVQKPSALPSNVKMLQANTVLPAVVNEDDDDLFDESDSEIPADKEEFLSANGDDDDMDESNTPVKDMTPEATADSDRKQSVSAISAKSGDTIEPNDESKFAEKLDESLCLVELEDNVHEAKAEDEDIAPAASATATATTADSEETPSNAKSGKQDLAHISADVA
ncbi:hypothetical protein N7509_011839 [Penicillium cosmopolitanum]|uniref:Ysc84 actin-binding domain-containing protein n=1 Tax=Penicillium cosmopolitanum TaxID=1131564 RepID=A0A9W9SIS0_9EURO|nr:uncharacterized protein N7509_011839 [Penicillium cosmopolitanum]KAJ5378720.1 hypothetical protein N7509_011839 [Penicillium cosmopolitanum]